MENIKRRRILVLSTAYYPFVGGAEIAIKEITDRLSSDFDFDLITARFDKNLPIFEKIGSVNVYRIGFGHRTFDKLILPFLGAVRIYKLNKKNNYFCIWAMMITFASGAGYVFNVFQFLSRSKKVPIVLSLQEGDSENHLNYRWGGLLGLSWKLALFQTDHLTALSAFLIDRARRVGYKKEADIVPNGVDLSVFTKEIGIEVKEEIRNKLGKKDGDVFLVTWSRLTHKNAVDDIISSLVSLPTNIYLIIMGKGEEGKKLQKQVDSLGLNHRVKFLGFVSHKEIPNYLSVCDIFIRPSRSEGFGNSFIEAMAAKLPVIATPVGGIPDFIDDNETGVFCAPNNPQSIANSVNLILTNNNLRENIVRNAYNRVVERYSWETVSNNMKDVFDKVSK